MFRALEANVPERLTQFGIKNSVNTDPPEGRLTPVSHHTLDCCCSHGLLFTFTFSRKRPTRQRNYANSYIK